MVEPPDIPASSEVWVDPIRSPPPPPPSPRDNPVAWRYAWGMRLVMLRVAMLEAEAGRRVVYEEYAGDGRYDGLSWLAAMPCIEHGCADACRSWMHVPRRRCGNGLGEGADLMQVEVRGCGSPREYAFSVRYEPLLIERVEDGTVER